jgi:hypothetical protein
LIRAMSENVLERLRQKARKKEVERKLKLLGKNRSRKREWNRFD